MNLLYLFSYYSSKVSRHSYDELQEHYFMKMMKDLWEVNDSKLNENSSLWTDLKILYYSKGCKNSLTFKNFLEMLPTIAVYVNFNVNQE